MASLAQAAANLAAALVSGNAQDAESALASYEEAKGDDAPEADNGPIKRDLDPEAEMSDEDIVAQLDAEDEADAVDVDDESIDLLAEDELDEDVS